MVVLLSSAMAIGKWVCHFLSLYSYYTVEICTSCLTLVKMKIGILKFENIGCLVPAQKGVAAPMKPAMPMAKYVNQFLSF